MLFVHGSGDFSPKLPTFTGPSFGLLICVTSLKLTMMYRWLVIDTWMILMGSALLNQDESLCQQSRGQVFLFEASSFVWDIKVSIAVHFFYDWHWSSKYLGLVEVAGPPCKHLWFHKRKLFTFDMFGRCNPPPRSLTARPLKMVVGRLSPFLWGFWYLFANY